jgi:putative transposase
MMTHEEFDAWAHRLRLKPSAIAVLHRIRTSPPERNVANSHGAMAGRFASKKMGHTIQWRGATEQRPLVLLWEEDPNCLEVWDLSWTLKLRYVLPTGKPSGVRHRIDFVVLTKQWAGCVDFRSSSELGRLVVEQPYRWAQTGVAAWDQPPAREACAELGLEYRLISDHDIPHVLVRNVDFLRSKMLSPVAMPDDAIVALKARLAEDRRVRLTEAIAIVEDAEIVFHGHFLGHWCLSLTQEALAHPDSTFVYRDQTAQGLFSALQQCTAPMLLQTVDIDSIEVGESLTWAGRSYLLVNKTLAEFFLSAPGLPLVPLSRGEFGKRFKLKEITRDRAQPLMTDAGLQILRQATNYTINRAIEKLQVLKHVEKGGMIAESGAPRRTYYQWKQEHREGEVMYGNGFIGLIDRNDRKGNRTPRTEPGEVEILAESFNWLRDPVPRETGAGYAHYIAGCVAKTITPRSLQSFTDAWNKENAHAKTVDRAGERAAYPLKAPKASGGPHLAQGPVEGDTPFGLVHIDHMQSDTFCRRMNSTQLLGKPWFTIAIDAFLRWVLGIWVSILPPSHMAVMMVLRDIVRRHGRLPMRVITDSGSDFKCVRVAQFLASEGSDHALRPQSEPRYGNPVERLNLDICHHLTKVWVGSNEVLKRPRQSSASHDPRALAYRTVPMVAEALEDLLFEKYPTRPHAGLQCTPQERLRSVGTFQGNSWGIPVAHDETLIYKTLASPHKHGGLIRLRDGIRVNNWNYYNDAFIGHDHQRLTEPPFYDPEDPTYIEARIGGRRTRCEMIDSQRRQLPPPEHRRFAVSEHIFLARPSTSKDARMAFLASMGAMYRDQDAERNAFLNGLPPAAEAAPPPVATSADDGSPGFSTDKAGDESGELPTAEFKLKAAPISRRELPS